jgi:hypothetical protein
VGRAHHGSLLHIVLVNEGVHMQGSTPPLPLSAVIAANNLVACITYEVIQEALHEVCVLLTLVTLPMPFSRSPVGVERGRRLGLFFLALGLLPAAVLSSP